MLGIFNVLWVGTGQPAVIKKRQDCLLTDFFMFLSNAEVVFFHYRVLHSHTKYFGQCSLHAFQNAFKMQMYLVFSLLKTKYILVRMIGSFMSAKSDVNGQMENVKNLAILN